MLHENYGNPNEQGDGSVKYIADLKRLASSVPFIVGCILITIGSFGSILFDYSWQNILGLAFAAVHIIALWLLVFESVNSPDSCSKTLTALSMFKVSAVLSLILICIIFGLTAILLLLSLMQGIMFLFIIGIVGGLGYVIIKYYFLALLKVLSSIRSRILSGKYSSLEGLGSFLVLSYIIIGINIIVLIIGLGTFSIGLLFLLANSVGMILCLRTLKKFE